MSVKWSFHIPTLIKMWMSVKDKALASSTSEDCHALIPDSDKDNT